MSSRFLAKTAGISAALLLAGCGSPSTETANASASNAAIGNTAGASVAKAATGPIDPRVRPYLNNQQVVLEGMALYKAHNCSGCHSNGGGGMGPGFLDTEWIYGGRLEDIHATLVEGRPAGMPSWKGKLTDDQMWKIAAYVRSMSLPETLAAAKNNTPSQSPAPVPESVEFE
ncbi:c-type cytochrome [Sphingomonas sp. CFBP 13603]|uniref:c-type cytochrome n=1 Tax=Sphingomonas sp. CFBP 13603 TaxID=2774040 RepID=UPI0018D6C6D3|nr:c-type cytochrome [Sphingomonas sp. CFBP 13603]